jgi:hypothetical protein
MISKNYESRTRSIGRPAANQFVVVVQASHLVGHQTRPDPASRPIDF